MQILAVIIGALICAGLAVLVAYLYKDKQSLLTPCGSCKQDCPSKEMTPKEQKKYYMHEIEAEDSSCRTAGGSGEGKNV